MKMKKFVAAAGVALTLGIASQAANAVIELKADARGDALLFPLVVGLNGFENYYAISNSANAWVQGHIRFRGAAWCGELLDFDVILSPGDVFVFRIADVDGDGEWEIDQSLDRLNFQYTGLLEADGQPLIVEPEPLRTSNCVSAVDGSTKHECMDPNYAKIPEAQLLANGVSAGHIAHQKNLLHFEFFGEAVLHNMDHIMMAILLSGEPGAWDRYQTDVFSKRGTSAWKWSNAANSFATLVPPPTSQNQDWRGDRGLRDVGNWLSGVGFISTLGMGMGVAYNAEALVNFRTKYNPHRVENYRKDQLGNPLDVLDDGTHQSTNPNYLEATPTENRAVIVHNENGAGVSFGPPPFGTYRYAFLDNPNASRLDNSLSFEARISYNNTWGPTLADGDDYNLTRCAVSGGGNVYNTKAPKNLNDPNSMEDVNLRWTVATGCDRFSRDCYGADSEIDDWDNKMGFGDGDLSSQLVNSIAEVEEAIRVGGQNFGGYYFDDAAPGPDHRSSRSLQTWFAAFSPTKFIYAEELRRGSMCAANIDVASDTLIDFETRAILALLRLPKTVTVDVWNIEEQSICGGSVFFREGKDCISPFTAEQCAASTTTVNQNCDKVFGEELAIFPISYLKDITTNLSENELSNFRVGRTEMLPTNNDPVSSVCGMPFCQRDDFPTIIYNFDNSGSEFSHWRKMVR